MEALIPAPAYCEVRSIIEFLNAESIAPNEVHRQLYQVYSHTRLDGQHIPCRFFAWEVFNHNPPYTRTSRPVISIFSYTLRNSCPVSVSVFRMTERWRWVSHSGSNPRAGFYDTCIQTLVPRYEKISIPEVNMLENSSTLAVSVSINLSIKLSFVSVHDPGKLTSWTCYVINSSFILGARL